MEETNVTTRTETSANGTDVTTTIPVTGPMAWIRLKANTKTGFAKEVDKVKGRTIEYDVWGPVGDGAEFLRNFIQEYGETMAGKVLRKQWVVLAQATPRRMMEKGAVDHRIQEAMKSWKPDLSGRKSAKEVESEVVGNIADQLAAATSPEEVLALVAKLRARKSELDNLKAAVATEVNGEEESHEEENGEESDAEASGEAEEGDTVSEEPAFENTNSKEPTVGIRRRQRN